MIEATKAMFTNYANFSGRTNRKDFWMAILGYFILSFVVGFVGGLIFGQSGNSMILSGIWSLATIVPCLALEIRRLHDVNKSGWYILMCFIPLIGAILVLIQLCKDSVNEGNNY